MLKLGGKRIGAMAKMGQKNIHSFSKFGSKVVMPAATLASIAAPEFAVPIMAGASVANPVLKSIEKLTR